MAPYFRKPGAPTLNFNINPFLPDSWQSFGHSTLSQVSGSLPESLPAWGSVRIARAHTGEVQPQRAHMHPWKQTLRLLGGPSRTAVTKVMWVNWASSLASHCTASHRVPTKQLSLVLGFRGTAWRQPASLILLALDISFPSSVRMTSGSGWHGECRGWDHPYCLLVRAPSHVI